MNGEVESLQAQCDVMAKLIEKHRERIAMLENNQAQLWSLLGECQSFDEFKNELYEILKP